MKMAQEFREFISRGNVIDLAVGVIIGAAFGLGFIMGPALGGLLVSYSHKAPFYFAGALSLVNALLVLLYGGQPSACQVRQASLHTGDQAVAVIG